MPSEPKRMYECSACEAVHELHHLAEDCCVPEVATVWLCGVCEEVHYKKADAESCCADSLLNRPETCTCPGCLRDFEDAPMQQAAISVAGHCTTCNPIYTIDQQLAIEDLHQLVTGQPARLNI
jgi:hypothetical protein